MFNNLKYYLFIIIIIVTFTTCNEKIGDYEISSRPQAVTGIWGVTQFLIDDVDCTKMYYENYGFKLDFTNPDSYRDDCYYSLFNDSISMRGGGKDEGQFNIDESYTIDLGFGKASNYKKDTVYQTSFGIGPLGTNRYTIWKIIKLSFKSQWWIETNYNNKKYSIKLMYLKNTECGIFH